MYTWPREKRHDECEVYHREKATPDQHMKNVKRSHCLFFKSHEPWYLQKDVNRYSVRGALLLRHPYDAAFSEYKRYYI